MGFEIDKLTEEFFVDADHRFVRMQRQMTVRCTGEEPLTTVPMEHEVERLESGYVARGWMPETSREIVACGPERPLISRSQGTLQLDAPVAPGEQTEIAYTLLIENPQRLQLYSVQITHPIPLSIVRAHFAGRHPSSIAYGRTPFAAPGLPQPHEKVSLDQPCTLNGRTFTVEFPDAANETLTLKWWWS